MNFIKLSRVADEPGPYTRAMVAATRELGLTSASYIDCGSVEVLGKVILNMAMRIVDLENQMKNAPKPKGGK